MAMIEERAGVQEFMELADALRREIQRYGTVPWQRPADN